jgi:hypothetical protein
MISLKNFSISKFTQWVKVATNNFPVCSFAKANKFEFQVLPKQNKIAHFLDSPASLFRLEDNKYSASSRLAGKPKKSTLLSVQLPFLG